MSGKRKSTGVSRSSYNLSKIIPELKNLEVLDLGSGIGYMSVGALLLGAKRVIAVDIDDVVPIIKKNLVINNLPKNKLKFCMGNLFENIGLHSKFDVIIANLPQHALPATSLARKLTGKYGGYDGTDIVCRSLAEAVYYLRANGRYYGSISELTNFKRTFLIAKSLYKVTNIFTIEKELKRGEMSPWISDQTLLTHLKKLKFLGMINFESKKGLVTYKVHACEFQKK